MTQPDPNAQSGVGGTQSGTDPGTQTPPDPNTGAGAQSGGQTGGTGQPGGGSGTTSMTLEQALAELEKQQRRANAADQNQAKLQADLKQYQDAQLSEQEKIKRDLEEANKAREQMAKEKQDLELRIAFLSDKTYEWRNPEHALRLVDLSGVEFKDGKITGLKEAVKALADNNKYLLAEKGTGDGANGGQADPPTGSTVPMTGQQPGNAAASKSAMAKQFPALRTRGIS
jgi:hypothetical protein